MSLTVKRQSRDCRSKQASIAAACLLVFTTASAAGARAQTVVLRTSPNRPRVQIGESGGLTNDGLTVRVVAELSASTVYVGERVVLTYRILSRDYLSEIEVREQPPYAGFWVKELRESAPRWRAGPLADGLYDVAIKRVLLYPMTSGRLRIDPLTLAIRAYPQLGSGGIAPGPRTIMRSSQSLTLEVRPLPPPPADGPRFTGAVGQFSLAASLQPSHLRLGEMAEMEIKVRGNGNSEALIAPTLPESARLKFFVKRAEPQSSAPELRHEANGQSEASWHVTVAASRAGSYELPLAFTYFDPRSRQYRTARATTLRLEVDEAQAEQAAVPPDGIDASRSNGPTFESPATASATRLIKWVGYGSVGLGILIAVFVAIRRRRRVPVPTRPQGLSAEMRKDIATDARESENDQSRQRIEDCLEMAGRAVRTGDGRRFYAGMTQALATVFEVRFGLTPAAFTTESIAARLTERGLPTGLAREAAERFSQLEAMRFSPQAELPIDEQELSRVRRLITELTGGEF